MSLGFFRLVGLMAVFSTVLALTQIFLRRFLVIFLGVPGGLQQRIAVSVRSPYLWVAAVGFIAGAGLWLWLLPRVRLSIAYPMISMSYIAMLVLGHFLEGEPVHWENIAGVLLIVGGVALLGMGR
ncbi:MAG: EamA family transporter [Candidatus Bipolaricaulota bacterium]